MTKMRVINLLTPFRSGIYQFHCNLLPGLVERGCSVTWLSSGSSHAHLVASGDAVFGDGEVVAPDTDDMVVRTRALVERVSEISPDVVICPALGDPVELNAIRYLSTAIHRILILHATSLATYRGARAVRDHVNATVAICPRIEQDLISTYTFQPDKLHLIPHGIDIAAYSSRALSDSMNGHVRILFHGRVVDEQKGIFWLPEILSDLARHTDKWDCTISGDGPDLAELKRRFARTRFSDRINFTGWTAPEDVPKLMSQHDVFLFPTKYEGNPIALIEAMASGCVPVASRLPGVTDWIIEDGVSGFQFPVGGIQSAVRHLLWLLSNRPQLGTLRLQTRESVSKYSLDRMAEQYFRLLCEVQSRPGQIRPAEHLDKCELAKGLRPAWWYRFPDPIKARLRLLRERVRTSVRVP